MGIRDRDYMRDQPDDDAYEQYEQQVRDAEYGAFTAKRQARFVRGAIALVLVVALVVVVAVLLSRR